MTHLTDTHRSIPVTPDMRGLSRWITQRRNRLRSKRRTLEIRTNHTDLDGHAEWLLADYTRAVKGGAGRHELAAILTGISGCLLVGSACWYARGWSDKAERERLSGLLLAEVAACASENPSRSDPPPYQGPRAPEFQGQEITDDLTALALAYQDPQPDDDEFVVWGCLSALVDAVAPITEGAWSGLEILADMSDAHFAVEHPAQEPDAGTAHPPARTLEKIRRNFRGLHRVSQVCGIGAAVSFLAWLVLFIAWIRYPSDALDYANTTASAVGAVLVVIGVTVEIRRVERLLDQAEDNRGGSA